MKRLCNKCGKELVSEGYVIDYGLEYYCSEECLYTVYSKERWENEIYGDGSYYTEFEEEYQAELMHLAEHEDIIADVASMYPSYHFHWTPKEIIEKLKSIEKEMHKEIENGEVDKSVFLSDYLFYLTQFHYRKNLLSPSEFYKMIKENPNWYEEGF